MLARQQLLEPPHATGETRVVVLRALKSTTTVSPDCVFPTSTSTQQGDLERVVGLTHGDVATFTLKNPLLSPVGQRKNGSVPHFATRQPTPTHTMGRRSSFFGGGGRGDDLWRAAHKLDDPRVRELLLKDPTSAQLNAPHASKGTTPLMAACKKSRRGGGARGALVVQHLLEFGADVHAVDRTPHRNTALHYAAYADAATAVEYLLHAGASAFALNHKGHSPLDIARLRGRKQAAAALTQHLRLKSGWIDVNYNALLPLWRRRWCVVLACNAERSRFEVCLFEAPDDLTPEHVLHIDAAARAECVTESSNILAAWTDKPYMFTFDRQILFQGVRGRRFSRDPVTGLTQGHGTAQVKKVVFGAESEHMRREWMAVLASGAHLAPSSAVFGQTYLNYPGTLFAAPQLWPNSMPSPLPPQHQPGAPDFDVYPAGYASADYGDAHQSYNSFSPSPRDHLESPTTLVPAFASSVSVTVQSPPSAPSFSFDDRAFYHGPGSFVAPVGGAPAPSSAYASSTSTSSGAFATSSSDADAYDTFSENSHPNSSLSGAVAASADIQEQSQAKTGSDTKDCAICMDAVRDAICVPCGHIAGCHSCLSEIKRQSGMRASCPICRSLVHSVVKIYEC